MSLFARLRAVVAGDGYLGEEDDDIEYDRSNVSSLAQRSSRTSHSGSSGLAIGEPFGSGDPFAGTNVIGMPGISPTSAEVYLMEPRSFDEMPRAIHALRERKTVILNLSMMESDQAQRAVDFVAGGTFAIDGHQERVGESIFLFAPSCVTVTTAAGEELASPTVTSSRPPIDSQPPAPSPAWGRSDASL